jgi:hypothetical protein
MLSPGFVVVGTAIGAIGGLAYAFDTLRGKIKPNRVSFLLWSLFPLIAFAAELKQGVGISSLLVLSQAVLPLLVFIASFVNKQSEWKLTRFDLFCGLLSLIGLALWLVTRVGNIAIVFSIMADGMAAVPTIRKAYLYPETEVAWPWAATALGVVITLLTLKSWTFAAYGFLVYLLAANLTIAVLAKFKFGKLLAARLRAGD